MRKLAATVLVLSLGAALACGAGERRTSTDPRLALRQERGRRLYSALCASCHGEDGRARAGEVVQVEPPAGDLTRCNFKYRSTPSGQLPTDSDLLRTIAIGIPGTRMPSFSSAVVQPSLGLLVHEVKRRCQAFLEEEPGTPAPWPGPAAVDAAAVARGRGVFEREQCRACHGEQGTGDGVAAVFLKDSAGRRIRPRDFSQGVFRGGYSLVDIYRAFSTGLNGTPMPALPASVPAAERWDLARYVGSLGRQPDGRPRRPMVEPPFWYRRLVVWGAPR